MKPAERNKAGIAAWMLRRSAADTGLIGLTAVMAFGQAEFLIHLVRFGALEYEPIFMVYLLAPVVLAAGAISAARCKTILRRMDRRRARGAGLRCGPAAEAGLMAAASAAAAFVIDCVSYSRPARLDPAAAFSVTTTSVLVGGLVGIVSYFRFRSARRRAVGLINNTRRIGIEVNQQLYGLRRTGGLGSIEALRRRRVIESVIIVIGSVMTFGLVEFAANVVVRHNTAYRPVDMVGMLLPMAFIMGAVSYASLRVLSRALFQLVAGIEKVGAGDFEVELDPSRAGPYRNVFENFNAMCRELRNMQTLRDDFINHFSHEFKTPIASINGFARILLEEELPEDERKRYLGIVASESERLAEMAGNALAMATLDSQELPPAAAPFALDEELKRCAILLSPQWTAKGIDLTADLDPVIANGNADLLRRVWINLLGNAIKFTSAGGKILVSLRKNDGWIEATIADTGAGMSEEDLRHAFEKYYQGTAGRAAKGIGLGLSIAQRIVTLSGGEIRAKSKLGSGSAFTVRLPV